MNESVATIERVCFNFLDRCSMRCPFCFVPFSGHPIKFEECLKVIDRCHDLGSSVITFCGGDPCDYWKLGDLLQYTTSKGMEIHVDTNGIGLQVRHYNVLQAYDCLLALPLDGDSWQLHSLARKQKLHYYTVLEHLSKLRRSNLRVKINTVVSALNKDRLLGIAALLCRYSIVTWSVYQFWPQGLSSDVTNLYYITDAEFQEAITPIEKGSYPFQIERSSIAGRHNTYFFVSHDGLVYSNNPSDPLKYITLGSIFDDRTISRWKDMAATSVRPAIRSRYSGLWLEAPRKIGLRVE